MIGLGRVRGRGGNKRNNWRTRNFSHKKNGEYNDIIISEKVRYKGD